MKAEIAVFSSTPRIFLIKNFIPKPHSFNTSYQKIMTVGHNEADTTLTSFTIKI